MRLPDGRERKLTVDLLTADERAARVPKPAQADGDLGWTFTVRDGIGVLTTPDWTTYHSKWDWKGFLDESLTRATRDKLRGLVFDIRDCEGGTDCGDRVVAHLVDAPLSLVTYQRYVRYRRAPADLVPYLDTWDRSFLDWGAFAVGPDDKGFYRLTKFDDEPGGDVIAPVGPRFRGKVAVLVGPENSSATFQLANTMKRARLGRLFGASTGGNLRGINGGAFFFLRLPGTGLEVDLPLVATLSAEPMPDAGVEPDVPVRATRDDVIAGRDVEMASALAWIAS